MIRPNVSVLRASPEAGSYPFCSAAVVSIAEKIGCVLQTLHEWVKKAQVDNGKRAGVPTDVAEKLKALECEVRELRQADEILRKASAYFAQAELDPLRSLSNDPSDRRMIGRLAAVSTDKPF